MPGRTPAWPQSKFFKRHSQIIQDDKHILYTYFFLIQPIFYGFATYIHIGGRANTNKKFSLPFYFRYISKPVNSKLSSMFQNKSINHIKPDIMPCMSVFVAKIS